MKSLKLTNPCFYHFKKYFDSEKKLKYSLAPRKSKKNIFFISMIFFGQKIAKNMTFSREF